MELYNKYDKEYLRKKLDEETFHRVTLSFYKYVNIPDPSDFRNQLFMDLSKLGVFGRIYVAKEGINGQISVPEYSMDSFREYLETYELFKNLRLNIAIEDDGKSFYKLIIKARHKIVADGLDDDAFDTSNVGTHLSAEEFNKAMEEPGTIIVDMRNHYESEIGHFENAICPDADTFKQELPMVIDMLADKKDEKILLYCTGGIRCEKASAYFKYKGFTNVNQLQGGIIHYARQIKAQGLPSKFIGKNFVFDDRLGERIGNEIISACHQCGKPADTHINCANYECHLLFIQCEDCKKEMEGCCSKRCQNIIHLPIEEQRKIRKGIVKENTQAIYKSRLRPDLSLALRKNTEE